MFLQGKYLRFGIGGIFWGFLLVSLANLQFPANPSPPLDPATEQVMYVVDHGYHTGLILPAEGVHGNWNQRLDFPRNADWYEFGWGDRAFYPAPSPSVKITLTALLLPSQTTLHVCAIQGDPEQWAGSSRIQPVCTDQAGMDRLEQYVIATFAAPTDSQYTSTGPGIYGESRFYHARGNYHLMHNCNGWTASGLKEMGISTSLMNWTPMAVFRFLPETDAYSKGMVR